MDNAVGNTGVVEGPLIISQPFDQNANVQDEIDAAAGDHVLPPTTQLIPVPGLLNTLPDEVLTEIIKYDQLHEAIQNNGPLSRLVKLRRLNRRWDHLIHSTPLLWTFLSATESLASNMVHKQNPEGPLQVWGDWTDATFRRLLHTPAAPPNRYRTVDLCGTEMSLRATHINMLSRPTPLLTTLRVASLGNDADRYLLDITVQNLRHLNVRGIQLKWTDLHQLVSMQITHLSARAPSSASIITIINSSPQLKYIHLEELDVPGLILPEEASSSPPILIHLPHLEVFRLRNIHNDSLSKYLAASVVAPKCRILEIDSSNFTAVEFIGSPNWTLPTLVAIPLRCESPAISVQYDAGTVTVSVEGGTKGDWDSYWKADSCDPGVSLSVTLPHGVEEWRPIMEALSIAPGSHGRLEFLPSWDIVAHGPRRDHFLREHLDIWTHVTSITFNAGYRDTTYALRYLSGDDQWPDVSTGPPLRWPCPLLTELVFLGDWVDAPLAKMTEGVIDVLNARSPHVGEARADQTGVVPSRLTVVKGKKLTLGRLKAARRKHVFGGRVVMQKIPD